MSDQFVFTPGGPPDEFHVPGEIAVDVADDLQAILGTIPDAAILDGADLSATVDSAVTAAAIAIDDLIWSIPQLPAPVEF